MISAKFVPLKYYTLSSQLRRLTSFSVGLFGSANSVTRSYPVMRKSCIRPMNAIALNYIGSMSEVKDPLALMYDFSEFVY